MPSHPPPPNSTTPIAENTAEAEKAEKAEAPEFQPGEIRSGKLAGKTMAAGIIMLALPVLLEHFANAFVGLVDVTLAGHLPSDMAPAALDGIGIASYVRWFIGISNSAIGIGGGALIARGLGGGDRRLAHAALGQSLTFSVLWGVLIGVLLWFAVPWVSQFSRLSPGASHFCTQYIRVVAIVMPFNAFFFTGMMCLHGAGETTRPFYIMILVNIINVLLSWTLSGVDFTWGATFIENPFSFDLNVVGIAMGTAGARVVGAILMLRLLRIGVDDLRLEWPDLRPHAATFWRIVRIGIPGFMDGFGLWIGQLFAVLWVIGKIGEVTGQAEGMMGAHAIAVQWEAFAFMPGFALGTAAATLAGQYLGAGNPKMAARSILTCAGLAMVLMQSAGFVFILAGEWLTRIVSNQPFHLENVPILLDICGSIQIFFALSMVIRGGLRGVGDTRWTMTLTWFSTYCVRLPLAWYLGYYLGYGIVGVWFGLCSELVVRGLLFFARFMHGGWKTVRI